MRLSQQKTIYLFLCFIIAAAVLCACQFDRQANSVDQVEVRAQGEFPQSMDADWPMEGRQPERARLAPLDLQTPLQVSAEYEVGGNTQFGSPVTVSEGVIYAEGEGVLHAISLNNQQKPWHVNLLGSYFSPAVSNGTVYVRTESGDAGYLVALGAEEGAKLWEFKFPSVGSGYDNIGGHVTSPVVVDGLVIVGAGRSLFALDGSDGAVRWEAKLNKPIASSASVADGVIFVTDFNDLYALDLQSGEQKWRFSQEMLALQFAPIVIDGIVVITGGEKVYAVDAVSGEERWNRMFAGLDLTPAAAAGDTVYVKSVNTLYALAAADGQPRWQFSVLNFVSLPAVTGDSLIAITRADDGSQLRAIRRSDGVEAWRSENLDLANSAPIIANGRVYVRTMDGRIIEFAPRKE